MYGRRYGDRTLSFEPSGGLANSALVLQDKETDTYWSLMRGVAESGALAGTELVELPVGEKLPWSEWLKKHPETQVLSVGGREDGSAATYADYFASEDGFRGQQARDRRLPTKAAVFAFRLESGPWAVAHTTIAGGRVLTVGKGKLLFHRPAGADVLVSTSAFGPGDWRREKGRWVDHESGCHFDPAERQLVGRECPRRVVGFDTYWYTWSLSNPATGLLE